MTCPVGRSAVGVTDQRRRNKLFPVSAEEEAQFLGHFSPLPSGHLSPRAQGHDDDATAETANDDGRDDGDDDCNNGHDDDAAADVGAAPEKEPFLGQNLSTFWWIDRSPSTTGEVPKTLKSNAEKKHLQK